MCGAALPLLLTGCIDNNYDLSDIDTTSKFKVNDLVIPLNLDPVVLDDIIKIKEGDNLTKDTINGNVFYAVKQTGEFHSDGIEVGEFSVQSEPLETNSARFTAVTTSGSGLSFTLTEPVDKEIEYKAEDIDSSITKLSELNFKDMLFVMTITAPSSLKNANSKMNNVSLTIPKGLTVKEITAGGSNPTSYPASAYNPDDGSLLLSENFDFVGTGSIQITANGLKLSGYGSNKESDGVTVEGSMTLNSVFNLEEATLSLNSSDMQGEVEYRISYSLGELNVKSILGSIKYDLTGTGLEIEPVNLENMPSFLEDPQTDLVLSNPQIYLNLINPIGKYGLSYQSSLDIISVRDDSDRLKFSSPLVKVPAITGDYNFMLAPYPDKVSDIPEDYNRNIEKLQYDGLGKILSGDGLPKMLDLELVNPRIPDQEVTSPFELGTSIEGMEGTYEFLAPLSLAEGSTIVKSVDGWWTEDLSDLNIEYLTITANATNGTTMGVVLNVFAIDRDGNQISKGKPLELPENARNEPIEITLEGLQSGSTFNNLDGVKIYVIADENSGEPLGPDQTITLETLRAKVTGYYEREL